jgi:hypothetical protein
MPSFVSAILWWLAAYFLVGASMYVVDRRWGVPFVRWSYDQWHRKKWDAPIEKGFFYGRTHKPLKVVAALITIGHFALLFYTMHYDFFVSLFLLVFDYFSLLMGYRYLGKFLYRQFTKLETVDDVLDAAEGKVRSVSEGKGGFTVDSFRRVASDIVLWIPRLIKSVVYPDTPDRPPESGSRS